MGRGIGRRLATASFGLLLAMSATSAAVAAPSIETPATRLRETLGQLLGQHAYLTVQQMRAGISGAPDFRQAAEAVEANTRELEKAIAAIYGDEAAAAFGELWRSHIAYIVDYGVALTQGDEAGKRRAVAQLRLVPAPAPRSSQRTLSEKCWRICHLRRCEARIR